jgi:hypothetical protein
VAPLRRRKNSLIASLRLKALASHFEPEQTLMFERLYRAARTQEQQDEITKAIDLAMNGWKTATDGFARALQAASDIGELADDDEGPELTAHLERARVSLQRR